MSQYAQQVNQYLLALKKGYDEEQFENLYDVTAGHLLIIARIYLTNKSLAEDVVIECFSRLLQYIDSFDSSQDGYNWMCKIVQNVAYTTNSNERRIALAEQLYVGELKIDDITIDLSHLEYWSDTYGLDEREKELLYRRFYLDETVETIAREFGVSKPAISMRIKNICKKLNKKMKKG